MVVTERHAHDTVTDADAFGAGRDPCQEDLGRGHVRVPLETVVLDGPDAVEPHLLGEHRLIDAVTNALLLVLARWERHLRLEDHRELHSPTPRPLCYKQ